MASSFHAPCFCSTWRIDEKPPTVPIQGIDFFRSLLEDALELQVEDGKKRHAQRTQEAREERTIETKRAPPAFRLSDFGNVVIVVGDYPMLGEWRVLEKYTNVRRLVRPELHLTVNKGQPKVLIDILKWIHIPKFVPREQYFNVNLINHYIYFALLFNVFHLLEHIQDNATLILNAIDFKQVNMNDLFIDIAIIVHSGVGSVSADFFDTLLNGLLAKSGITIQDVVHALKQGTPRIPGIVEQGIKLGDLRDVTYKYFIMADYADDDEKEEPNQEAQGGESPSFGAESCLE